MGDTREMVLGILRTQPLTDETLAMLADPPEDFDIAEVSLGSLDAIVFCMAVEDELDVPLEAQDLADLARLSDLVALLDSRIAEKAV